MKKDRTPFFAENMANHRKTIPADGSAARASRMERES